MSKSLEQVRQSLAMTRSKIRVAEAAKWYTSLNILHKRQRALLMELEELIEERTLELAVEAVIEGRKAA